MARPRLALLTGRIGTCIVGVVCTMIALILVLPIPFANLVPAMALAALSLGLTCKDGLLLLSGYGLLALAMGRIALGIHGIALVIGHVRALF